MEMPIVNNSYMYINHSNWEETEQSLNYICTFLIIAKLGLLTSQNLNKN